MTKRDFTVSLAVMLAFSLCYADDQPKDKFAELEGTWTIVKIEIHGKSLLEKDEKWKLVIKDGKVSSDAKNAPRDPLKLAKILDPGKKPKTVMVPDEGTITFYGICQVKGDELHVCVDAVDIASENNPEARPSQEIR